MRQKPKARVIQFRDGSFGRVIKVESRVVKRTSRHSIIRNYIDFMFDKLLEWLEDGNEWYDDPEEITEYAEEHIYERILEAPEDVIPCDNGKISLAMFLDYIFKGELLTDQDIADDLIWIFEPEDIEDMRYVVECYDELLEFRNALRSIKVKVKGGNVS